MLMTSSPKATGEDGTYTTGGKVVPIVWLIALLLEECRATLGCLPRDFNRHRRISGQLRSP
jgi:hypothetical protein